MYIPDHFRTPEADVARWLDTLTTGTLITVDPATGRPMGTFLPWVPEAPDRLTTHIARVNPQATHNGPALIIVMGADAYIPGEWLGPGIAPSWNYETLHLDGELTCITDPDRIKASWDAMMRRYSAQTLADLDVEYVDKRIPATTTLEFRITAIQAKSKLSQNHTADSARRVADHLEPTCPALADRMRTVSLPHIAARDERVRQAVPYQLD